MTSGAELIMVLPADSVETVGAKIRASRAPALQLLVADDAAAFHQAESWSRIAYLAGRGDVALTVISSDELTIAAAQTAQLDVLGVDGARVAPQIIPAPKAPTETQAAPYQTRYIPRTELEQPLDAEDADFLDDLDHVPNGRERGARRDDMRDDDLDDFDDFDQPASRGTARTYDDDLDDDYIPPRRRFDDDLEDVTPLSNRRRSAALPKSALAPANRRRAPVYEDDELAPRQRSGGILLPLIVGSVLALALVGAWLWSNRPVVYVWPAPSAVRTNAFVGEVIPVADNSTASEDAVKAAPLATTAELTVQGRASQQLSPAGTARGTVQLINALQQPIELPAGTQFIATNPAGQSVSLLIDSPATVPPAVTSSSIFGSSTTFGTIEVAISARSPGSASNVDANTVTQLIRPDGQTLGQGGGVTFQNQPIQGGSEAQIYIVTEPDVRAALGDGLAQLYQQGVSALQTQQVPSGFVLDPATVFPDPQALGDPVNYEPPAIAPAVGQPVADQANPVFTMTLKANFSALAAPPAPPAAGQERSPVAAQLQTFVPNYLYQQRNNKLCEANETPGVDVTRYVWNGQQLAVDGAVTCTPPDALADATLAEIKQAVVGQPAESAAATLAQLRQSGAIGGYQLPQNVSAFPSFAFMVRVERAPDGVEPPQGRLPAPTPGATPPDATAPAATETAPTTGATP